MLLHPLDTVRYAGDQPASFAKHRRLAHRRSACRPALWRRSTLPHGALVGREDGGELIIRLKMVTVRQMPSFHLANRPPASLEIQSTKIVCRYGDTSVEEIKLSCSFFAFSATTPTPGAYHFVVVPASSDEVS